MQSSAVHADRLPCYPVAEGSEEPADCRCAVLGGADAAERIRPLTPALAAAMAPWLGRPSWHLCFSPVRRDGQILGQWAGCDSGEQQGVPAEFEALCHVQVKVA